MLAACLFATLLAQTSPAPQKPPTQRPPVQTPPAPTGLRPKTWFGPATVTFPVQFTGNPYDPAENDVRVRFVHEKKGTFERIAYFDQEIGGYSAVLVAPEPGRYHAVLTRNGTPVTTAYEARFDLKARLPRGYVRTDPTRVNRLRWDDGEPYWPLGFNLGWQAKGILPMREQIAKMGAAGVNWTRIWASSWDGKNPWWPQNDPLAIPGWLWPPALATWRGLVEACDQAGVGFQMVLFNHGSFSSKVDPNWPEHPWNAAKEGFLMDAADFFTDPEAKRRTKMWLRYAVARYAHSPRLVAWELFNEVEWTDAAQTGRWADVAAWHAEMAAYLRSLDPYGHLVTTSSIMDQPTLWAAMDTYQPHTYAPSILASIAGRPLPRDKPAFYGEVGGSAGKAGRASLRDAIYAGMLSNHAGAAMFWPWEIVEKRDLYGEFGIAANVLDLSGFATRSSARRVTVRVETEGRADLSFGPGAGWEKAGQTSFQLPLEATPDALAKLPSYFQSSAGAHKELFPAPLTFRFTAKEAGVFTVRVEQVAKGGARLRGFVNGQRAFEKTYPATEKDTDVADVLEAPFPAGPVTVRLDSDGADWARLESFTVEAIAPQATALALAQSDWLLVRLTAAPQARLPLAVTLAGLPLTDGRYDMTIIDLDTGDVANSQAPILQSTLQERFPARDAIVILKRHV